MKHIFILLTISIFISCNGCSKAQETKFVDAAGGLRMRSSPDLNGEIVAAVPNNSEVTIIEEKSEVLTIADATGKWTKIRFENSEGWVFGGFLLSKPLSKTASRLSENCLPELKSGNSITFDYYDGLINHNYTINLRSSEAIINNDKSSEDVGTYDENFRGPWSINKEGHLIINASTDDAEEIRKCKAKCEYDCRTAGECDSKCPTKCNKAKSPGDVFIVIIKCEGGNLISNLTNDSPIPIEKVNIN